MFFFKYDLKKQNLVAIEHTIATKLTEMVFDIFKIATTPNKTAPAETVISMC